LGGLQIFLKKYRENIIKMYNLDAVGSKGYDIIKASDKKVSLMLLRILEKDMKTRYSR
jgi:hypothetical protein